MRTIMTHGYMLSGTGSNIYVQSLCRALVSEGHDVHLLCQDPDPLSYDFVSKSAKVDARGVEDLGEQETTYPGLCVVYRPEIGDLLPVYVYDEYQGWRVKTFLDLTQEELDNYLRRNVDALKTVLGMSDAEAVITNHSVPGPLIARRALEGDDAPYVSIVHGSCLQYVSRKSESYMVLTREGLEDAREILALSSHSAGTIAEDFPDLAGRTHSLPGGVDTELFHPDAYDLGVLDRLEGGPGRGRAQRESLGEALRSSGHAGELAGALRAVADTYDARSHDTDAGERLRGFLDREGPLVVYVGKLIRSKGVHSLISAFSRVRKETGARLLVIGFGTFREGLEALDCSLSAGDEATVERLAEMGKLLEGGPAGPLEHFELTDAVRTKAILEELAAMGMRLAIDDFGTGYSSLAYLKRLPITQIKIDRSFVMAMATNEDDATIVRSTIDLGRNLGLEVVAEGVETEPAWTALRELGCTLAQGYYLSRPLPPELLTAWLLRYAETGQDRK